MGAVYSTPFVYRLTAPGVVGRGLQCKYSALLMFTGLVGCGVQHRGVWGWCKHRGLLMFTGCRGWGHHYRTFGTIIRLYQRGFWEGKVQTRASTGLKVIITKNTLKKRGHWGLHVRQRGAQRHADENHSHLKDFKRYMYIILCVIWYIR